MRIKPTIVAYALSVQCSENATIMAYAGLRVNYVCRQLNVFTASSNVLNAQMFGLCVSSVGLQHRHVNHIRLDNSLVFPAMNHIKSG